MQDTNMKEFEFIAKHVKRLSDAGNIAVTFSLTVFPDNGRVCVNVFCAMSHEYIELKDEEDFVEHIDMLITRFTQHKKESIMYHMRQIEKLKGSV